MHGSRMWVLICVGLAVVAVTSALLAAGPMSRTDYKSEAARCVEEIYASEDQIWDALQEIATSTPADGDATIGSRDAARARAVYVEESGALKSAAARLAKLRAPLTCRRMDENLCAWIDLQEGECMDRYGAIVDRVSEMTYDELGDRLEEHDRSMRAGHQSVIVGFGTAVKELDVDLSH